MAGKTFVARRGTTPVPNRTVHDKELSYAALGVLVVLLGRPDGAGNGYRDLMGRGLGEKATRTALRELDTLGYRHQFRRRVAGGTFETDTLVSEVPITREEAQAEYVDNPANRAADVAARSDQRKHPKIAGRTVQHPTTARSAVPRSRTASLRAKGYLELRSSNPDETKANDTPRHGVTTTDTDPCEHGFTDPLRTCAICRRRHTYL